MMKSNKSYKFRLYPNKKQAKQLDNNLGVKVKLKMSFFAKFKMLFLSIFLEYAFSFYPVG